MYSVQIFLATREIYNGAFNGYADAVAENADE
jgi:hypothetical protein